MPSQQFGPNLTVRRILQVVPGAMCVGFDPVRREPRPSDCFVYVLAGRAEYHFEEETVTVVEGGVMYIPRDSTYFMRVREPYRHIYVDFYFDVPAQTRLRGFSIADVRFLESAFRGMLKYWLKSGETRNMRCFAILYEICAALIEKDRDSYVSPESRETVRRALDLMDVHISDPEFGVSALAKALNIAPSHLRRLFQSVYDIAPTRFYRQKRVLAAKRLLTETTLSVSQIAEQSGFCNAYYFSRVFKQVTGITPSRYRDDSMT